MEKSLYALKKIGYFLLSVALCLAATWFLGLMLGGLWRLLLSGWQVWG